MFVVFLGSGPVVVSKVPRGFPCSQASSVVVRSFSRTWDYRTKAIDDAGEREELVYRYRTRAMSVA